MNYIVLDLEWNQGRKDSINSKHLPFEVIEIGAAKLDDNFNIVDQYGSIVKYCKTKTSQTPSSGYQRNSKL